MIRINLAPGAQQQVSSAGSGVGLWAVLYVFVIIGWGTALGFVYDRLSSEHREHADANAEIRRQIENVRSKTADISKINEELKRSREKQDLVRKLLDDRYGPTRVLRELSLVLSPGKGPSVDEAVLANLRKTDPAAGFSPTWDSRRLWLTSFVEENRACKLNGQGKSNVDVAEFLRRLQLSQVFDKVSLKRTSMAKGEGLISFNLTCEVEY